MVLLIYAGIYYLIWYFNRPRAHYLQPLWPALALVAAFAVAGLVARSRLVAWATWGVIGVSLVFGLSLTSLINVQFVPVVSGLQTSEDFLRQKTWYYDDIQYANRTLPENARMLCFPLNTFYLDVDFVPASIQIQTGIVDFFSIHSSEGLLARWKELGLTHVLWDEYWFEGTHRLVEHYGMQWELPEQFAHLINQGHLVSIYEHDTQIPTSRTLGTWQPSRVVLYEVRY